MGTKRGMTMEDHWRLKLVTDLDVSPDGRTVAYVVGRLDEEGNTVHSAIWLADRQTGATRQATSGETLDSQPRWSPDGSRLAFVSTRYQGTPQIFLLGAGGGEAHRLTGVEHGAHTPVWSPDGRQLCFSSTMPTTVQRVPQELEWLSAHPQAEEKNILRRQTALWSRVDPAGWIDRATQLFVTHVDGGSIPRQLTEGEGGALQPAWSPDGQLIAFVSNRHADRESTYMSSDVWTVEVEGGALTRLTNEDLSLQSPAWSPDGQTLAFFGRTHWHPEGFLDTHVWTVSRQGGDQRDVSNALDRSCGRGVQPDYLWVASTPPAWSPDGQRVYVNAVDHGNTSVYTVTPATGQVDRINQDDADVVAYRLTSDGTALVCIAATPTHPYDIWEISAAGGVLTPLVSTNADLLDQTVVVAPEHIEYRAPDGWDLEGWLYKPLDARRPYPLILIVHGGPHGCWGNSFYFEAQALAAAGYGSLYINPRGSVGYGEAFADGADWGQKDFIDLMTGIDLLVDRGEADGARLGITGISYGGFMTNWSIGHTDRFSAGVAINGISNFVSFYGVSDIGAMWMEGTYLPHFGPRFWSDEATWRRYLERSPITYVESIQTPLLLIQSENDYRCPIEQGEQLLTALRMRRQPVELVRFPGCAHAIASTGTPLQRYLQWKLSLDWFQAYIPVDAATPASAQAS